MADTKVSKLTWSGIYVRLHFSWRNEWSPLSVCYLILYYWFL